MKKIMLIAVLMMAGQCAYAAGSDPSNQTGKTSSIQVLSDGRVFVNMAEMRSDRPDCASAVYSYWAIADESAASAKHQIALLMAAHAAQRSVKIIGSGSCNRHPDAEDIVSVEML